MHFKNKTVFESFRLILLSETVECIIMNGLFTELLGERGGLVLNASDSGSRGRGFEPHSGQTVLCP